MHAAGRTHEHDLVGAAGSSKGVQLLQRLAEGFPKVLAGRHCQEEAAAALLERGSPGAILSKARVYARRLRCRTGRSGEETSTCPTRLQELRAVCVRAT